MAETTQGANGNGSVFISYSRKDKAFVQKLNDALDAAGVQAWVDWEGIELASDWMERITSAIQGTDAFLFIITPDSLKSTVCANELELGIKLNKKLIPILYREPTKSSKMHEKLAATNWVYLRKEDNFEGTLPKLIESINTDLDWVRQHTQLLGQAIEWEKKNKDSSFLLNGVELEEAERWMTEASEKVNRQILPLQAEYISTSRKAAIRRQRSLLIGATLAAIISLAAAAIAIVQFFEANTQRLLAEQNEALAIENQQKADQNAEEARNQAEVARKAQELAEENEQIARAERSVAQAQTLQTRAGELDTSTLLAIESYQRIPSFQAENLIRINSSLLAKPVAQMAQDGPIWNIEWSPDYQYFVTGNSHDPSDKDAVNQACVYQASDGKLLYCKPHDNDVNDALFTKDGRYLITASADQSVKFWDAENGELVEALNLGGAILDLDVSESVLAIAREDNFLTLYYLNKPDLRPVHVEQVDGVRTVKFSPSGDFLALGLQNGQIKFWHARNNFFYNGPEHRRSSYVVLAWSSDNLWLASGGGDSLARITKRDGTQQHSVRHQDWVEGVAFGPDPSWYATVSDDNIVRVMDRAAGTERFRMSHAHFAQKVIVSPDGQWIASTGYDQVVRVWDSVSGSQMLEMPMDSYGSAISFNEDGTRLVAADEDGNISIWDISKLKSRTSYIEFTEFVREVRFTPSGEFLIVNADDFNIWKLPASQLSQFKNGTEGQIIASTESLTYNTAISPDSQWVAVVELDTENAQKNRGTLVRLDGRLQFPLVHGGEVTGVAFTQDSQLVATSGVDGLIQFWDVQSGSQQFGLNNEEKIYSLAISPAGRLAAAGLDGKTKIWNIDTREHVTDLDQAGDISSMAFSQDGTLLATGSSEGSVLLWKVDGTSLTTTGQFHLNGSPRFLAFSPDNQWLAGGGSTSYAYLWDIASGQELARIPHGNPVTSVSFSPDGTQLFTVSRKVVRVWDVSAIPQTSNMELISYACSHLTYNLSLGDWRNFFGSEEYRLICPDLPEEK